MNTNNIIDFIKQTHSSTSLPAGLCTNKSTQAAVPLTIHSCSTAWTNSNTCKITRKRIFHPPG